ncbi:ankyrin [Choiromyces venosus 120613-1]|uniref:Ankyrin n=1 Tax=Choiromyces venosus 120613-1 TaxID=1336337 RepID=A0A3N4JBI4_9PEZI|nr:ankyrin [Choiromyces venosus 120613-1]
MTFLNLPNETILQIARVQEPRDLSALLRTNQRMARLLKTALIDSIFELRAEQMCKQALYAASSRGDTEIVKRLLDRGVLSFVGDGALLNDAVMTLDEAGLRVLLDCGIDPETRDSEHQTPLSVACRHNRLDAVKLLIDDERVDVNSIDLGGRTALSFACRYGHVEVVRLLLGDAGVDANLS